MRIEYVCTYTRVLVWVDVDVVGVVTLLEDEEEGLEVSLLVGVDVDEAQPWQRFTVFGALDISFADQSR